MGVIETSLQFYFLAKILKKKIWPPFYFLFAVCATIAGRFLLAGTIIGFMTLVFLLTVCGMFVCHADFKSSLLYAALTTEIMLLCYGIVKSLISLLCLLFSMIRPVLRLCWPVRRRPAIWRIWRKKCHSHAAPTPRSWIFWWETNWELQKAWR